MRYRIVVESKEDPHEERISAEVTVNCWLPLWYKIPLTWCMGYPEYLCDSIDLARKAIKDHRRDRLPWKRTIIEVEAP